MRKLLVSLVAVAALAASAYYASYAAPRFTAASGCSDASQLLSCLNQAVGGSFGSGSSGNVNVTMTPAGTSGLMSVTANVTAANTAPVTINVTDSALTGGSICLAQVVGGSAAAGSAPFVASATSGAGILTLLLSNATNVASGANPINIAFWCFQ